MKKILYEDQYFYITKCEEYPNVSGMLVIYEKDNKWYVNKESIKRLAILEKTIREELMNVGKELAGIYREEYEDNKFRILIIPYDVKVLVENNISPDLYQPYIKQYLDSYKENNDCDEVNRKILIRLKEQKYE